MSTSSSSPALISTPSTTTTSTPTPSPTLDSYLSSLPELSTARAQFLWSSFGSRKQSNPTGYAGALSWWRAQLTHLVSRGLISEHKLVLVVDDQLREKLRRDKLGRPASLGTVVGECVVELSCIPLDTFLSASAPISATSPSSSSSSGLLALVTRPLSWAASRLLSSSDSVATDEQVEWSKRQGTYVLNELVEKASSSIIPKLQQLHVDPVSRLYTLKTFRSKLGSQALPGVDLSERDCEVLIKHLSNKGLCVRKGETIKFRSPSSSPSSPLSITSVDSSILSLTQTLASLDTYITSLQTRIQTQQELAVSACSSKQPASLIKSHLIQRKQLESVLAQRIGSRDQLGQVVLGIERASGDEEMVRAMDLGAKALEEVLKSPGLRLEEVERVNERMRDALDEATEVHEAIEGMALEEADERDVEDELTRLQETERKEEERKVKDKLDAAGKVPEGTVQPEEEKKVQEETRQEPTRKQVLAS